MDLNLFSQSLEVKEVTDGIDDEYIWQRRIQKSAGSFPDCAEIGLNFDVAHKRKEKLDLELLTNGIVLDICDFAKAASKAEKYFICEILEYNFDLSINDDIQRCEFATHVHKCATIMKDTMKNDLKQRQEVFVLPDPKTLTLSSKSSLASQCYGKEISEESGISAEGSRNSDVHLISSEPVKADTNGELNYEATIHKPRGVELKLNRDLFPCCEKIGLDLDIRPKGKTKQKLHLDLLTKGVMSELYDFAKVLSGSFYKIVFDVLEHNFDIDLQSDEAKAHEASKKIRQVLGREEKLPPGLQELRDAFREGILSFENVPMKMRKGEACTAPSHQRLNVTPGRQLDLRNNQEETHWGSEISCSSETTKATETESKLLHVKKEENDISISSEVRAVPTPLSYTSDGSQEEDQPAASDFRPTRLDTNRGQVSDLFFEETDTDGYINTGTASNHDDVQKCKIEQKMLWRRRSARSKEILSVSCKGRDPYGHCRNIGLDFNVGSGRKQSLDLQLMTYGVVLEISKFARQMNKAHIFFTEILENHFNISFHNDQQRKSFQLQVWHNAKPVVDIPGLRPREVFELPMVKKEEVYSDSQLALSRTQRRMEPHPFCREMETYPFCREIGLDLHAVESRKMKDKLSLLLLTNGVMNEMATFAKDLAGSHWPIVHEILEHNFDLDLQSGKTEVAKHIQSRSIGVKNRILNKDGRYRSVGMERWLNTPIQIHRVRKNTSQTTLPVPESTRLKEVMKKRRLDMETERERRIVANKVTPPQSYSKKKTPCYPLCEEIGLELDVKSKSEAKEKLDLSLLTRAIVYEIHKYIKNTYSCDNYSWNLYGILDYNFDLSSQNRRRREFIFDLVKQVKAVAYNKLQRMSGNENIVFQLPFKYSGSSAKTVKRVFKKQRGSQSTQNTADRYSLDWQRPVQVSDFCVTQQPDQYYWSMETESQFAKQTDRCSEMNTCHTSVTQEAVLYAEQSVPQQSTGTSVGSVRPFQEHIPADKRIKLEPEHTSYWGVETASHPERQVDICRKIIHDIATSEGTTPQREIFHRLADIFSDGTGTDEDFKGILDKYKSEILPAFVKEYGNLSPSQQFKVSEANELMCGINLISGLAHQSKTILELWEKMISGESKFAVHMNNGMPELVSRTELLVRKLSDIAKKQVCTKEGKVIDFRSFLTDKGEFEDIPLTATKENTINRLFKDAAGVYSICDELVEYTSNHVNDHGFLGADTADLEVQPLKAGCRALGLVSKLIIDPLWKALTSKENLLEMEMRYQTLISKLIEWQEDGRDMVEGSACLFDDVEVQKDLVFDRLTMQTDAEVFELTVQIVEVMLASFVEVCCKMLTSEIDQDLRMDVNCRKYSQIVEHLQEARLRDVSIAFDSMFTFKGKRMWKWLQSLEEKQVSLLRELHYSLMQQCTLQQTIRSEFTVTQGSTLQTSNADFPHHFGTVWI